jgi:hypothetical protein
MLGNDGSESHKASNLPNRNPSLLMAQIAYFPAQDGLGQKMRHKRTVPIEVFTDVAEEHDVASLANERGHHPPTAPTGNIVVGQRNRGLQAQVVG